MEVNTTEIQNYVLNDLRTKGIRVTDQLVEVVIDSYNQFLIEKGIVKTDD